MRKPRQRCQPLKCETLESRRMLADAPDASPLLPDLIPVIDEARGFLHGWTVEDVDGKTLLRLGTTTINLGNGPLELRGGTTYPDGKQDVYQRIFQSDDTFVDQLAGQFHFHPTHGHMHFEDYAQYNLRARLPDDGVGELLASGGKTSFCLLDVFQDEQPHRGQPETPEYAGCGSSRQGLSVGWADMYDNGLPDQWIDVTGIPSGQYWLEVVVDPENHLAELNETNNTARILIDYQPHASLPPDALEPSQSSLEPRDLGRSADLKIDNLSIHQPGNDDWYYWTAPASGVLTTSLAFDPAQSDLNLFLYAVNPFYQVAQAIGTSGAEAISYPIRVNSLYVLRVVEVSGRTVDNYSLSLSVTNEPSQGQADSQEVNDVRGRATRLTTDEVVLPDLSIHSAFDRDYFRWRPTESGVLEARIDFDENVGDLDLYVYDARGRLLGWSTSLTGAEQVGVNVAAETNYFVKIIGNRTSASVPYALQLHRRPARVVGDANGDGIFDSGDLIEVFQAGQYEDDVVGNSMFRTGDWNDDGEFDSGDLVTAFQVGHYATAARPEIRQFAMAADRLFAEANGRTRFGAFVT